MDCLKSIFNNPPKVSFEVIVVDNASTDNSVTEVRKKFPTVKLTLSKENLGYAKGNNLGVKHSQGEIILFLNPDTKILDDSIQKSVDFLKSDAKIGGLTCRVLLPDGSLDYSCQRGFPTPWNSFCYFSGLAKLFPKSKLFSSYIASFLDINTTHPIDAGTGAFLMVKREAGEEINFWDEDYFWNGEDLEFCFNLKEKGWQFYYFAESKIIHYKGSSSGLWKSAQLEVSAETKTQTAKSGILAMRIFYEKHYKDRYPLPLQWLISLGINLLQWYRLRKVSSI